ncbi:MAG: hypothetical protein ACN4GW_06600 [Desulforhopalus sp.]
MSLLLTAIGLILIFSGVRLSIALLIVFVLGGIFWLFTRKPRPKEEMPSNTVSCCHYLGDNDEEQPR